MSCAPCGGSSSRGTTETRRKASGINLQRRSESHDGISLRVVSLCGGPPGRRRRGVPVLLRPVLLYQPLHPVPREPVAVLGIRPLALRDPDHPPRPHPGRPFPRSMGPLDRHACAPVPRRGDGVRPGPVRAVRLRSASGEATASPAPPGDYDGHGLDPSPGPAPAGGFRGLYRVEIPVGLGLVPAHGGSLAWVPGPPAPRDGLHRGAAGGREIPPGQRLCPGRPPSVHPARPPLHDPRFVRLASVPALLLEPQGTAPRGRREMKEEERAGIKTIGTPAT